MKKLTALLTTLILIQVSAYTQVDTTQTDDMLKVTANSLFTDTSSVQEVNTLAEVSKHLDRARKGTNAGLVLGSVAQLSLIVNGGFLDPNEAEYAYQGIFALIGAGTGIARVSVSFAPIAHLSKAYKSLEEIMTIPGYEEKYILVQNHVRTAKNASIAIPVFGISAFGLMVAGYATYGQGNEDASNGLFATAWICTGAGLLSTIIASANISKARKELSRAGGTVSLGINQNGIGVGYRF